MLLKKLLQLLQTSQHPVAKAFHKGTHFRILIMTFNKGMTLKDHHGHFV
jgi:hypothetical protein